MTLYTYFDGATGPVGQAGWTNYSEGYARAEVRAQAERKQAVLVEIREARAAAIMQEVRERAARDGKAWRAANWQRICAEMRKAVEGKP